MNKEKGFSADSSQPLKMAVFPRPVSMKRLIIASAIALSLALSSGCQKEEKVVYLDSGGNVTQPPPKPEHVKRVWAGKHFTCYEIDGHHYLVYHNDSYYNEGVNAIVHAESCPCRSAASTF